MRNPLRQVPESVAMVDAVPIQSRDFWVKVLEMPQQHWVLIEPNESKVTTYFLHDLVSIFDELNYPNLREAQAAHRLNGFRRYEEEYHYAELFAPPAPPFRRDKHPNGLTYSSGQYWTSP